MAHNGGRTQLNLVSFVGDFTDGLRDRIKAGIFPHYNYGYCNPDYLDADGWPVVAGVQYLFTTPRLSERPGLYIVRWQGSATWFLNRLDATVIGSMSGTNGSFAIQRNSERSWDFTLVVQSIDVPGNPPHHIQVFHEDDVAGFDADNDEIFIPRYLQVLNDYRPGVLRFLEQTGAFDMWTHIDHVTPYTYSTWGGFYAPKNLWAGTTTNSGTDFSVAFPGFVLTDKASLMLRFNVDVIPPATCTLNINGTGAKPIISEKALGLYDWQNQQPGANGWGHVVYDALFGAYLWKGGNPSEGRADAPYYAGLPRRAIINLCNRIGAHPWIHFGYMAYDSDVVNVIAAQFRDELDTGLVPRFEYGNENWNGGYAWHQNSYCLRTYEHLWGSSGTVIESTAGEASGRATSLMGKRISAVFGGDRTKYQVCNAPFFNGGQKTLADSEWRAGQAWHDWFEIADHVADGGDPAHMWATHFTINNYWSSRYGSFGRYTLDEFGQDQFNFGWAYAAAADAGDSASIATLREQVMAGLTPDVNSTYWGVLWNAPNVYAPMADMAHSHGLQINCYEGGIFHNMDEVFGYIFAPLTNITKATQAVLTLDANSVMPRVNDYGFVGGGYPYDLTGMPEILQGQYVLHKVVAVSGHTITIDLDTTSFTPYVGGGKWCHSGYGEISAVTAVDDSNTVLTISGTTLLPRGGRILGLRGATGMTALNYDGTRTIKAISGRNITIGDDMTAQPAYTGGGRIYFQGPNEWQFVLKAEGRMRAEACYGIVQAELQACVDLGIEFPSNYTLQNGGGLGALPGSYWGVYSPYFMGIADFNNALIATEARHITTQDGRRIKTQAGELITTQGEPIGATADFITTQDGRRITTQDGRFIITQGSSTAPIPGENVLVMEFDAVMQVLVESEAAMQVLIETDATMTGVAQ